MNVHRGPCGPSATAVTSDWSPPAAANALLPRHPKGLVPAAAPVHGPIVAAGDLDALGRSLQRSWPMALSTWSAGGDDRRSRPVPVSERPSLRVYSARTAVTVPLPSTATRMALKIEAHPLGGGEILLVAAGRHRRAVAAVEDGHRPLRPQKLRLHGGRRSRSCRRHDHTLAPHGQLGEGRWPAAAQEMKPTASSTPARSLSLGAQPR